MSERVQGVLWELVSAKDFKARQQSSDNESSGPDNLLHPHDPLRCLARGHGQITDGMDMEYYAVRRVRGYGPHTSPWASSKSIGFELLMTAASGEAGLGSSWDQTCEHGTPGELGARG